MKFFSSIFLLLITTFFAWAEDLSLAKDGKTDYVIVTGKDNGAIQKLAVQELKSHLEAMTGAVFHVSETGAGKKHRIYLGLSEEARNVLGKENLAASLREQENVIQVKGKDLFLYGKGKHGTIFAVYELLENKFGCRWLSVFEEPYIPSKKELVLKDGTTRTAYAFPLRSLMNYFYKDRYQAAVYNYRNRQNLLLGLDYLDKGIVPELEIYGPACHTLSVIIPGFTLRGANRPAEWHKIKDYFAIHPEWFSMDEKGKRISNRQLCFSNKEMRKEYIKNALEMHRRLEQKHGKAYLTLDLNDIAYRICCCPDCMKMEQKYQSRGGAFFDMLIEFCRKYPKIEFATLAYQRGLTQTPPVVKDFPQNLTIIFCPINGLYSGTMDKENKNDMNDMLGWLKLTPKVWVWYYPNTYGYGTLAIQMPMGNFERIAQDIRLMHKAGIQGTYFEHDSGGIALSGNLSEMQSWVMYKLFQNPDLDVKMLMKDFAEHYYGKAAPAILKYAEEMEQERKNFVAKGGKWQYNTQNYHYLTAKYLLRWNKMFDDAAKMVSGKEAARLNMARMGLDCAIIDKLSSEPDYKDLVKICRDRLTKTYQYVTTNRRTTTSFSRLTKWLAEIDARGKKKPLPEMFRKIPQSDLLEIAPLAKAKTAVKDPDAHMGVAQAVDWDGKKFNIGTYDYTSKSYGPGRAIYASQVKMGEYSIYKIQKPFIISPDLIMWGGNWGMSLPLRALFKSDNPEFLKQKWTLYVSLKFTKDKVYLDRGILVKAK